MALRVALSALDDLRDIKEYYTTQGIQHVGDEYVAAIMQWIELLRSHPDAGRMVPELDVSHVR